MKRRSSVFTQKTRSREPLQEQKKVEQIVVGIRRKRMTKSVGGAAVGLAG
jgi:hypothetical protein